MKKLFLFAGIVAVLALIPLSSLMATQDEAPATTDQIMLISLDEALVVGPPKVAICHFGGHNGDFVTTGPGGGCTTLGGCVLVIARPACEKGHKANNPNLGGVCTDNNVGVVDSVNRCG